MSRFVSAETAMTASANSSAVFSSQTVKSTPAAELLALPGSERLERVHGDYQRNSIIFLRVNSTEMGIPGVTMNEVRVDIGGIKIVERWTAAKTDWSGFWTGEAGSLNLKAAHAQIPLLQNLIAETADFDRHRFRQFPREIIHMHARAAIDMRWIFVREKERFH